MPCRSLFIGMSDAEYRGFGEGLTCHLQGQRQTVTGKTHRQRQRRDVGHAERISADPAQDHSALERRARLAVDLGYCAIELVFDEPEFDARAVMQDAARAIGAVLAG